MQAVDPVVPFEDVDTVECLERRTHFVLVLDGGAVHGDVVFEIDALDDEAFERSDVGTYLADRHRYAAQRAGLVGHAQAQADGVCGRGGLCSHNRESSGGFPVYGNRHLSAG